MSELKELLAHHQEWYVQVLAARELGKLGAVAAPALSRLRELQSDEESAVRDAATQAIAQIAAD